MVLLTTRRLSLPGSRLEEGLGGRFPGAESRTFPALVVGFDEGDGRDVCNIDSKNMEK